MLRKIVPVLVASLWVPTVALVAAEGPPPEPVQGEEILFQEVPSVFGASKYEQKAGEAPSSVTIVTAEEIEKYGYRTLADILRAVRGLYVSYDRNYTYLGARGFGRSGDYNTRVLLLIDGHPTNDDIYDSAYFGTEGLVDVSLIQRVEVIRGPSSSLYGTNAFLAVVNVITRSGRDYRGLEAGLDLASYDAYTVGLTYGVRSAEGPELLLSASNYHSDGRRLFFPEYDDPSTNNGMSEGDDGDIARRGFLKIAWADFAVEGGFNYRRKEIPTGSFGTIFDDPRTHTVDERAFLNFKLNREMAGAARLEAVLSYDYYRYDGRYAYAPTAFRDYGYGDWYTAAAQYQFRPGKRHRVISGGEYRYNARMDQGGYDEEPRFDYLEDSRSTDLWAVFVQDEIRLNQRLILNAGVRHDHYETFGGTTNPRVALIAGLPGALSLKAMYGTAFRAPNAYELYYHDSGTSQKANPDLEPETIETYELALERIDPRRGIRMMGSIYRYEIRDLISQVEDPSDLLLVFQNLDRVRAQGVEGEVEARFARILEGRFSYTWQEAEDVSTGEKLVNSPRHLAKANLAASLIQDFLTVGFEGQYVGPRRTVAGPVAGGFTVANLVLVRRDRTGNLEVTAGVYNLFDRRYADPAGAEHLQVSIPQDDRNYRLQLKYRF
jgi:iron complex outermembrane receptor protein